MKHFRNKKEEEEKQILKERGNEYWIFTILFLSVYFSKVVHTYNLLRIEAIALDVAHLFLCCHTFAYTTNTIFFFSSETESIFPSHCTPLLWYMYDSGMSISFSAKRRKRKRRKKLKWNSLNIIQLPRVVEKFQIDATTYWYFVGQTLIQTRILKKNWRWAKLKR